MVLVSYWPLNETSGSTAKDVRGNNDGTINSGVTLGAKGILSENAYNFNGSDGKVDLVDLNVSDPFSVCGWVKIDTLTGDRCGIISDSSTGKGWFLSHYGDSFEFGMNDSGGANANWSKISTDTWYHVVGVFKTGTEYLYINGELKDTVTGKSVSDAGKANIGYTRDYIDGQISEIRYYNHALTKQEIQYLYQVGKRGLHTSDKRSL